MSAIENAYTAPTANEKRLKEAQVQLSARTRQLGDAETALELLQELYGVRASTDRAIAVAVVIARDHKFTWRAIAAALRVNEARLTMKFRSLTN